MTDYQSELQDDLKFYISLLADLISLSKESLYILPHDFRSELRAWVHKKIMETSKLLMELNP